MTELRYIERKPVTGADPDSLVTLLHGLGADANDLIGLAPYLAQNLPDTHFISPDAPYPCDMAPFGRQWFSLQDWSLESIHNGVLNVWPVLESFIEQQQARFDLPASKIALLGFSQGGCMALHAGLQYGEKLAGVLSYSGWLSGADVLDPATIQKPPVCLIHGESDEVVPVIAWHKTKDWLEAQGFDVSGHTTPGLGHGIDESGIAAGSAFLSAVL